MIADHVTGDVNCKEGVASDVFYLYTAYYLIEEVCWEKLFVLLTILTLAMFNLT